MSERPYSLCHAYSNGQIVTCSSLLFVQFQLTCASNLLVMGKLEECCADQGCGQHSGSSEAGQTAERSVASVAFRYFLVVRWTLRHGFLNGYVRQCLKIPYLATF